jgi:hypothetical protein
MRFLKPYRFCVIVVPLLRNNPYSALALKNLIGTFLEKDNCKGIADKQLTLRPKLYPLWTMDLLLTIFQVYEEY